MQSNEDSPMKSLSWWLRAQLSSGARIRESLVKPLDFLNDWRTRRDGLHSCRFSNLRAEQLPCLVHRRQLPKLDANQLGTDGAFSSDPGDYREMPAIFTKGVQGLTEPVFRFLDSANAEAMES